MKSKKTIVGALLLLASVIVSVGCSSDKKQTFREPCSKLSWDGPNVIEKEYASYAIVDIRQDFETIDTFDASGLINADNFVETLTLEIKSNADIVKAEKLIHYYPTIWSDMEDEVIQLIYLFDHEYTHTININVDDNVIEYNAINNISPEVEDHFRRLTPNDILHSIKKVPEEY